jgi:hypothetical protein
MASDESDNNSGKLPKETDLTAFYASDKDKTVVEDKLKKMREGAQLLTIMNQPTVKIGKIIIASTNPKLKNQILQSTDRTKSIDLTSHDDQISSPIDTSNSSASIFRRTANVTLDK